MGSSPADPCQQLVHCERCGTDWTRQALANAFNVPVERIPAVARIRACFKCWRGRERERGQRPAPSRPLHTVRVSQVRPTRTSSPTPPPPTAGPERFATDLLAFLGLSVGRVVLGFDSSMAEALEREADRLHKSLGGQQPRPKTKATIKVKKCP